MKKTVIILVLLFTAIVSVFAQDETVTIDGLLKTHEYRYLSGMPFGIPNFEELSFGLLPI